MGHLHDREVEEALHMIHIVNSQRVFIGTNSAINREGIIEAAAKGEGDVCIGNNVQIGPYVVINSLQHKYKDPTRPITTQGHDCAHVIIGNDIWIGARVTILYGSIIPDGCVIGSGSTVTRHDKLEPNCVYVGGFPLRKIGKRE
jgi:acetyltransferase-like isoleucine patch superfamily enzyme